MADTTIPPSSRRSGTPDAFQLKVRRSRYALFFEQLWPRFWLVIGVIVVFLVASLGGLWGLLDPLSHKIVLAAFVLALLAAVVYAGRVPWPSREDAVRRLEVRSGLPHRPATSYEDNLTINRFDPATQAIWQAHRTRLADLVRRLRVGRPSPRTDRRDPFAIRALLMLAVVMLLGFVGDSARDRVMAAFRFGPPMTAAEARLDAWVTPPAYTARPPLLLADGARGGLLLAGSDGKPLEVPENSIIIARTSGKGAVQLELDVRTEGTPDKPAERLKVEPKKDEAAGDVAADVSEVRYTIKRSGEVRVLGAGSELVKWSFVVIPDKTPTITMTRPPEISRRGSIKTFYKMADDYGIASAELVFERFGSDDGDPRTAWAREETGLKGPRLPYDRPPTLTLRQPSLRAKDSETWSFHELASHPWSGMRTRMTLVVKDHAGNVGHSQTIEMTVPERIFLRPLARAVIEQRRLLAEDSRYRQRVVTALDALTYEPAGFIDDRSVYLGLRSARHRLVRDKSRAGIANVREHLWHIAQRIEDGRSLSDAQRRLRELQEQLSQAIQNGASDEEIQRLMQELRQALNQYLQELARQGQDAPQMDPNQLGQNQTMSQQDLDRMMNQLENMLRQGSREMAQEMLSQLRDLLDRLQRGQMGQMGQMGQGQGQQMMQMMDQMGDMIRRQQQLQDDTFGEQRRQRGQGGQEGEGQEGQQGQQQGQGRGQQGQGQGQGSSPGDLARRQGQLRDQLGKLREGMRRFGQQPGQLDGAAEAMENARRALERGDLDTATREEGRALEQLRQGARQMAEQMMRQMGRQFGSGPNGEVPRDPLGRPQRSEGPDLGTTVKVPDEIDIQRAREIMEELRRRLGEQNRPTLELDYIERLLRRF